jgi:hypothetical protein
VKIVAAAVKASVGASARNIDNALDVVKGGDGGETKGKGEEEQADEDDEGTGKRKGGEDSDSDAASDREDVGTLKKRNTEVCGVGLCAVGVSRRLLLGHCMGSFFVVVTVSPRHATCNKLLTMSRTERRIRGGR